MRDSSKEPTNAVVARSYSNGPVFEDVAAEKKEKASNINHGNTNAEIAEDGKLAAVLHPKASDRSNTCEPE